MRRTDGAEVQGLGAPTVPSIGPTMPVVVGVPLEGTEIGNPRIESGERMSPRMSTFVSRSGVVTMPPGARTLLALIVLTTSVKVKRLASSRRGSTVTSYAAV